MRIQLSTCKNSQVVPFDYQQKLIGTLHKWIGINKIHDMISLYSFSWLQNGALSSGGFDFPNGANWFIAFHDQSIIKQIIRSLIADPEMFCGMSVQDLRIMEDATNARQSYFNVASPILIKRSSEDKVIKFYTFNDQESDGFLIETLKRKIALAGLPDDDSLTIHFDTSYVGKKTKKVRIHDIDNIASICPVVINGRPDVIRFAMDVGLGDSTGSGFGFIY